MSILLGILTFILILVSIFLVLVVLAQKSKDGGIGAALGGGATEAAFGADTANVLTKATKYSAILFFTLALALYMGRIYERTLSREAAGSALPSIAAPAVPSTTATPAAPATSTVTVPTETAPAAPVAETPKN